MIVMVLIIFLIFLVCDSILLSPAYAIKVGTATYQRLRREQDINKDLKNIQIGHFDILTEEALSAEDEAAIRKVIEAASQTVESDFGYTPEGNIEISLLGDDSYQQVRDTRVPSSGFYSNQKIRMNIDTAAPSGTMGSKFARMFLHEYTHLVIAASDGGRTPRWLSEGLAEYEEVGKGGEIEGQGKAFLEFMEKRGKKVEPKKFFKTTVINQYTLDPAAFLTHSYVISKYLAEQYGFEKLRELFKTMKTGSPFTAAFYSVYNKTPEEIAQESYKT